jgi:hypothetical protein
MYQSQPQGQAAKTIDPQLMINCTFDMDYLEITKNESLRKYEENVYLLGSIFSNKLCEQESEDESISIESDYDDNQNIFSIQRENDISSLVTKFHKENCSSADEKTKILLTQLEMANKDLQDHQTLLENNKNTFKENKSKFNDFYQKLRSLKASENENYFKDTLKQADEIGVLSETFKQYDNYITERHKYNCELPFDPSNNIVIMPL